MNPDQIKKLRSKSKLLGDIAADLKVDAGDFPDEVKEQILEQIEEIQGVKVTLQRIISKDEENKKLNR